MVRFLKKGVAVPLPEAAQFTLRATQLRAANALLDRRAIELQREIDARAYELVEHPSPALEAKVSELERERDAISALKRRHSFAADECDRKAESASAADTLRRVKETFANVRRLSGTRAKEAERIAEGLKMAFSAFARLQVTTKRIRAAIAETPDMPLDHLLYDHSLAKALQHAILQIGRENGVPKPPGGAYCRSEFNVGLAALMRASHEAIADTFTDEAALSSRYVAPAEPEPEPELAPVETLAPHPMTDAEIDANEKAGNPLNLPLSGRAWQQTVDATKQGAVTIADDIDYLDI